MSSTIYIYIYGIIILYILYYNNNKRKFKFIYIYLLLSWHVGCYCRAHARRCVYSKKERSINGMYVCGNTSSPPAAPSCHVRQRDAHKGVRNWMPLPLSSLDQRRRESQYVLAVAAIGGSILRQEFSRDSDRRKDNRMSSGADECRLKGGHPPAG